MNKGGARWLIFIVIILGALGVFWGYKIAMKTENKMSKDASVKSLGYTGNPVAVMKTNLGEIKRAFRQRRAGNGRQFHKAIQRKILRRSKVSSGDKRLYDSKRRPQQQR